MARHLAIHRSPAKTAHDLQNELLPLCDLVDSIADLFGELCRTRQALVEREAELAAGIPLVSTSEDEKHVSARLHASLQGGAEAVDAEAAALYVLDEATSQLKLRASWGLPSDRLLQPARPLRGAVADLEALTGHAVAIEDVGMLPHWNVPEPFASALCVPVSSATTPLGTLWVFCDRVRDFSPQQTNIVEIVAGRVAAELERQVLLAAFDRQHSGETEQLRHTQDAQLPAGPIAVDLWEVAARCHQGAWAGCQTYDWRMHEDGSLTVALAGVQESGAVGATNLQLIRGAAKAAMLQDAAPQSLVQSAAEVAWTSTTGETPASLAAVRLPATEPDVEVCSGGPLSALIVRPESATSISQCAPPLASDPDARYSGAAHAVAAGEAVVLVSDTVTNAVGPSGQRLGEAAIADCVRENLSGDAERLVQCLFDLWRQHTADPQRPATILVAKRTAD